MTTNPHDFHNDAEIPGYPGPTPKAEQELDPVTQLHAALDPKFAELLSEKQHLQQTLDFERQLSKVGSGVFDELRNELATQRARAEKAEAARDDAIQALHHAQRAHLAEIEQYLKRQDELITDADNWRRSHEGQVQNTLAFQADVEKAEAEAAALRARVAELEQQVRRWQQIVEERALDEASAAAQARADEREYAAQLCMSRCRNKATGAVLARLIRLHEPIEIPEDERIPPAAIRNQGGKS